MAKKESEISVESKLQTLYQLQTTLSAIDEKRALRGELPLEVQDLEDEIAGLKTRVEHIEGDINDFQQAVAQKQGEIKEAEESVERYKKQLDEVRNNREYDTLTKEIEFQSLEIELCNKKIKEANAKVEDKKRELVRTNDLIKTASRRSTRRRASSTKSCRRLARRSRHSRLRPRIWRLRLSRVCCQASSASVRMPATVWASCMCSVTLAVAASTRFRHSDSSTSRCTRRLSFASTADVS